MGVLELTDSKMDMIVKMSQGNNGAITAIVALMSQTPQIDPDSAFSEIGPILMFDEYRIYGLDIYILWNDKCNKDCRKVNLLVRAVQLGFLPVQRIQELASDQTGQNNVAQEEWATIDEQVCGQLKNFQRL